MKRLYFPLLAGLLTAGTVLFGGCGPEKQSAQDTAAEALPDISISRSPYGRTQAGEAVDMYTLRNRQGMEIDVITYGGIITRWTAPDRDGRYANITLGFDSLVQYERSSPYFGALIGRYGNRIAGGSFALDGKTYTLETNNGPNHLHGGERGFDKVVWTARIQEEGMHPYLVLTYTSPDGEGGYPGTLSTTVTYTLTPDNALEVVYTATTDQKTVVNLTQHAYFNLSGDFSQPILDHVLSLAADQYLPVDAGLIPTGEWAPVAGTPFDFRQPKAIGQDIEAQDTQLSLGRGYDHCWVLGQADSLRQVASLTHPGSGRTLAIFTDEPGIQFYSGNFLDGSLPRPDGGTYGHRSGLCLETQHFPDSPNQPSFPSVELAPGETYSSRTTFQFSAQ
ncbi:MAG: galactose mutarotase [Bacteroidetes bacterium]|nr:MAG: galactose mutarotase [Bacteroidota bacterium]